MTVVDRTYILSLLAGSRTAEEGRVTFYRTQPYPAMTAMAADRAFSLSLLIGAVEGGLLEELAGKNEQLEREAAADFAHIAERDFEAARQDPDPDPTWAFIQSIPGYDIGEDETGDQAAARENAEHDPATCPECADQHEAERAADFYADADYGHEEGVR
jgi:hypothetical protein